MFAAHIAINAGVIDIESARGIDGEAVGDVCHKGDVVVTDKHVSWWSLREIH